ncbi:MFS general substrate transporter [Apiospora arundinis]|uniref:MFS general substrate transporter n=1 Tax=Apiospora arundinis TaxID=335852 RepID=A0ABR2HMD7_9PEZI
MPNEMEDANSRRPLIPAEGSVPIHVYGSTSPKDQANVSISETDDNNSTMAGLRDDIENEDDFAQAGVQQADAINLVWTRSTLIVAYFFIFLCSFASALQWQIISNLTPYVTSEFSSHSLIPTIGIVASILSGVLKLPISKVIDAWGRPQGLAAVVVLATIGLILMAACTNIKTYAAAQVFYQIGLSGFSYILSIIIADTSSLKNRALAFAFSTSPSLITTFIGPPIAGWFYEQSSWRWAFGFSSISFLLLSLPILVVLMRNARKAAKLGVLPTSPDVKIAPKSFGYYLEEFDVTGVILLAMGLSMIFVPFSLGIKSSNRSSLVLVAMGFATLFAFAVHEKYQAKKPIIPFGLLFSRNTGGSCLLMIVLFVSYFSWDSYYSSYLQVVHGLNIAEAGYIDHIYGLGSCLWAAVVGYLIRVTDRYKWLAWAGLPFHILGGVAMIAFRRPDSSVSLLVLCQVMITVGGSTLVVVGQMAVMAVCTHAELASVMAILSLASYIGSAGGNALSGAIWNSTLPNALARLLPDFSAEELALLCSDMKRQLSYPMGSPVRDAIITAYDQAQVKMCLTGTAFALLQIVAVMMWRDVRVSQTTQVKGKVI